MRVGWLVALAACGPYHVQLDPPRPDITPQERVAMFWRLRPTQEGYVKANDELIDRSLVLGDQDKIEVSAPEDLEPLVRPNSETIRYAQASVAERHKSRIAVWTGMATMLAGLVASGFLSDGPPFGLPNPWIGIGTLAVGIVLAYPVSRYYTRQEMRLRRKAFDSYTSDLGERLDVCAHGLEVVPCGP